MFSLLLRGHVLDVLKRLPAESVDCIVTSPPYFRQRVYSGCPPVWWGGDPHCTHAGAGAEEGSFCPSCGAWFGQLGLEPTVDLYVAHLLLVTAELRRVLKETGTLFLNINDTYSGDTAKSRTSTGRVQAKSLLLAPERLALRMVEGQGWILRNRMVWEKVKCLPSSVKDRFTNKWEYVFFFTKSQKYYFDLDAVRLTPTLPAPPDPAGSRGQAGGLDTCASGGGDAGGSSPVPAIAPQLLYNSKFIGSGLSAERLTLRNALVRAWSRIEARRLFPGDPEKQREYVRYIHDHYSPKGANPGDVIHAGYDQNRYAHLAVFSTKLVEPLIRVGCPPGGVVLDPFAGSGTVGVAAHRLGRSAILIELSEEYAEIIRTRMEREAGERRLIEKEI